MRLNAGCGNHYAEGWTNVDLDSPHRKDVTHDLREPLPFDDATVQRAYLGHVLEHLTKAQCARLLADLRAKLAPGAPVMVVGPDCDRAAAMHQRGEVDDQTLHDIRYGGARWSGDKHLWRCVPGAVEKLLTAAGYSGVAEVPIARVPDDWPVVSRIGWQCAVEATA